MPFIELTTPTIPPRTFYLNTLDIFQVEEYDGPLDIAGSMIHLDLIGTQEARRLCIEPPLVVLAAIDAAEAKE